MITLKRQHRIIGAGLLFMAALFFMMAVRYYYTWYMPGSPEAAFGKTIAVKVNYGKIVYVDRVERETLCGAYVFLAFSAAMPVGTFALNRKT